MQFLIISKKKKEEEEGGNHTPFDSLLRLQSFFFPIIICHASTKILKKRDKQKRIHSCKIKIKNEADSS